MRNIDLARDYIDRAAVRLRALNVLFDGEWWADVAPEAQEVVQLSLKALLRACGIDPPRAHDVYQCSEHLTPSGFCSREDTHVCAARPTAPEVSSP
jgi:HEPN domain-containing protein